MFYDIHYTIDISRTIYIFLYYTMGLLCIKTVIGYRFPWEKCICCGKKVRDHKKEK